MVAKRCRADRPFPPDAVSAPRRERLSEHGRRTTAAWERFASGQDDVQGVSPSGLLSLYRCRNADGATPCHGATPCEPGHRERPARGARPCCTTASSPSSAGSRPPWADRYRDFLSTVTDGDGRILSLWGTGRTARQAANANLAPFFAWPESAIGTKGRGTALSQPRPVSARGPGGLTCSEPHTLPVGTLPDAGQEATPPQPGQRRDADRQAYLG